MIMVEVVMVMAADMSKETTLVIKMQIFASHWHFKIYPVGPLDENFKKIYFFLLILLLVDNKQAYVT